MNDWKFYFKTEGLDREFYEEEVEHRHLSVQDQSRLPDLPPPEVYFRQMGVGLRELMGDRFPDANQTGLTRPTEITVMTYTVMNSFSSDVLEIIKNAASNPSISIFFCYYESLKKYEIEKQITGVITAFESLFACRNNVKVKIVVNPHTHIKLLQVDDSLYMGSMNFSSTADAINMSTLQDTRLSYHNHEVLFHYEGGGRDFTHVIAKKIEDMSESVIFEVCSTSYKDEIIAGLKKCTKKTIGMGKEIRKKQDLSLQKENQARFLKVVSSYISQGVREVLNINNHLKLLEEVFADDEVEQTIDYFKNHSAESFIGALLSTTSAGFIILTTQNDIIDDEDEDEDEDEDNFEDTWFIEYLAEIAESYTEDLRALITDENEALEKVSEDRLDYDDGEGEVPLGKKTYKSYNEMMSNNKSEVLTALKHLIDELALFIIDQNRYNVSFFIKSPV
ncbi:hypothetical protein PRCB_11050 [Pantoea rodasii]|uniref:PLD phosphodiesterase domain-containing protein n=1 Tax=Pantoea rodasii TaxID=1076549 RepID=A0A2M9WDI1_9GAMM|nr:hypothetical protein [Pantoea rodasii]ORM61557.1 hypothetical protein HA45_20695 [Pantoea rodasii]PJZ05567.1 hypothetical protein PRCB_11050 [Pantoea rodasii]